MGLRIFGKRQVPTLERLEAELKGFSALFRKIEEKRKRVEWLKEYKTEFENELRKQLNDPNLKVKDFSYERQGECFDGGRATLVRSGVETPVSWDHPSWRPIEITPIFRK